MAPTPSTRKATYYKIQQWEARSFAWKDVQRSYKTISEAIAAAPSGERDVAWRIMEISATGRSPLNA
jgi:hypothetical protein